MPRDLPIEVWEMVIDWIGADGGDRETLRACCLTCYAWLARSRSHLFGFVRLTSREHLEHVLRHIYSDSRFGRGLGRIRDLKFDGSKAQDQSWVSLVPMKLFSKHQRLHRLMLERVDLASVHTYFHMAISLFRVSFLLLIHLECTNWSQLSRTITGTKATNVRIAGVQHPKAKHIVAGDDSALQALPVPSGKFYLHGQSLVSIDMALSFLVFCSMSRTWSFSTPSLQTLNIAVDGDEAWEELPVSRDPHAMIAMVAENVRGLCRVFRQLDSSGNLPLELSVDYSWIGPVQSCRLCLESHLVNECRIERMLKLTMQITAADDSMTILARMLSSFSQAQLDRFSIQIYDDWQTGARSKTSANFVQMRYKPIDKALAHFGFANVTSASVEIHLSPEPPLYKFDCGNKLVEILLPRLAARNTLLPCDGDCPIHKPKPATTS